MGAWSAGATGNDVAQDMCDEFRAAFALYAPEDAVKKLDAYAGQAFLSDEWTDYLYALADFMEKNGVLTENVRARAIASIDAGEGLERWEDALEARKKGAGGAAGAPDCAANGEKEDPNAVCKAAV